VWHFLTTGPRQHAHEQEVASRQPPPQWSPLHALHIALMACRFKLNSENGKRARPAARIEKFVRRRRREETLTCFRFPLSAFRFLFEPRHLGSYRILA
jgi:hypothetical protein